ncbi:type IV pilin [Natrinema longum]|uniref:Type IV pilin N-terminal domain-containing protein n=1 Tax=Natrinema longum TaxID=370324 RepID=A0A8A2UBM6_9EURY|nr:type IV pilin N-terminal domain-containing protein [Natrinema longum]MBZ6495967.1 type IV pilin N-terminal domain-containing protein [Natrinema longum]QSW86096.1 type IV pilin N-terminal domain-containing protein [Natrinema longum]
MDFKNYRNRLVGNDEQRAVSPVIGVILMVAITVILAAVIAAFVLDLGGSVGQEAQAGVSMEVDNTNTQVQVEITSLGNADHVNITSSDWDSTPSSSDKDYLKVGDAVTYNYDSSTTSGDITASGQMSAVAVINESETQTQVGSEEWDFS